MSGEPRVVAIIPARGGAKTLPGKNVRLLAGKPLLAYTIEAARGCHLIQRVIVSTDDAEIGSVARAYGAEVPFMRPAELATDDATTESVLQHAVEWLQMEDGYWVDIIVFLQPTDLFRKRRWLEEVIRILLDDPTVDSAFVAARTYKNFWRREGDRFVPVARHGYGPRQRKEPLYREDTGLACATRAHIVRAGRRIGERVRIIETDDFCTSIDIHDGFDLWLAEKVITEWGRKLND